MSGIFKRLRHPSSAGADVDDADWLARESRRTAENDARRQLSDAESRRQAAANESRRQTSDAEARRQRAENEARHRSIDEPRDPERTD